MSKKSSREKRVTFRAGKRSIVLKPIPQTLLADVISEDGKPIPPDKPKEYMGGAVRMEPDYDDEEYKERLGLWQATYNARMLRVCIAFGVDEITGPPIEQEVVGQIEAAYGRQSPGQLQMRWCMYLIGDNIEGFLNLALGQTIPTEAGLAEAEERFPDTDEGSGDSGDDS